MASKFAKQKEREALLMKDFTDQAWRYLNNSSPNVPMTINQSHDFNLTARGLWKTSYCLKKTITWILTNNNILCLRV